MKLHPENAPLKTPMDIRVANPLAFMVQKFLIQEQRPARKRAQDVLYVFDTIGLFGGQIVEFRKMWKEVIGPALGTDRDEVLKLSETTFSRVTDDVRSAALIPQGRKVTADEIQSTCQYAFQQIFGG